MNIKEAGQDDWVTSLQPECPVSFWTSQEISLLFTQRHQEMWGQPQGTNMNHLDVTAQCPAMNPANFLPPPHGWALLERTLFTLFICPKLVIVSAQLPEWKPMHKPHHKSRRISNPSFLLYPLQSASLGLGCRTAPVSLWASHHQRAGREAQSREVAAGKTFWERGFSTQQTEGNTTGISAAH